MSEQNKSYEIIRQEILGGAAAPGSLLAKVMADLSPAELQSLRQKAAEGMIVLELQKLQMAHKFQVSSAEMDDFIHKMGQLERQTRGTFSTYKGQGTFEGASGHTTITTSKGSCLLILVTLFSGLMALLLLAGVHL